MKTPRRNTHWVFVTAYGPYTVSYMFPAYSEDHTIDILEDYFEAHPQRPERGYEQIVTVAEV